MTMSENIEVIGPKLETKNEGPVDEMAQLKNYLNFGQWNLDSRQIEKLEKDNQRKEWVRKLDTTSCLQTPFSADKRDYCQQSEEIFYSAKN